jgi:hypothetical protein
LSPAVSCYFWRKRFLLLGCIDGTFRVMDALGKPSKKTFSLPTQKLEALRCMKMVGGKVRIFHFIFLNLDQMMLRSIRKLILLRSSPIHLAFMLQISVY